MRRDPRGRKVYSRRGRQRNMFHTKHRFRSVLSVLLTMLMIGLLVVAGYLAAEPLSRLLHKWTGGTESTPDSSQTVTEPASETATEAATTAPLTTTASVPETTSSITTTGAVPAADIGLKSFEYVGRFLKEDALKSPEALEAALQEIPAGCCVIVPLKIEGGALLYQSQVKGAAASGACKDAALTIWEIAESIQSHQLSAIAQLSLLDDAYYPTYDTTAGFLLEDGYSRWLDNKPEKGGKPWMSPFSDSAAAYLQALTAEIMRAGFQNILCTDLDYPHFYDTDLELLGSPVQSKQNRAEGLIRVLNGVHQTASQQGGGAMYTFSLYDALNRDAEALQPVMLNTPSAVVYIDPNSFRDSFWHNNQKISMSGLSMQEKLQVLMPIAQELCGDMHLIPCFRERSFRQQEQTQAEAWLRENGYTQYMFK